MRLALLLLAPSLAAANPWTRDQGHFFLAANYSRIATSSYFAPDFKTIPIVPYEQHVVSLYGEVGLYSRWLTATVEGTLYRRSRIVGEGYTEGVGDWRVGLWSGVVDKPVRFTVGMIVGIPTGDATPSAGAKADRDAQQIAR